MSLHGLLINSCSIERPIFLKDTAGGPITSSFQTIATDIATSIQARGGRAIFMFAGRQIFITHRFYFDADVGIKRGDRLKDPVGQYYIVHNYSEMAGRGVLWIADVTLQLDA